MWHTSHRNLREETDAGERVTAPGVGLANAKAAHARAALATLPYEQRQAIELAFLGGMSQDEIAEALSQPPGIIAERIRRGMLRLREGLRALL